MIAYLTHVLKIPAIGAYRLKIVNEVAQDLVLVVLRLSSLPVT